MRLLCAFLALCALASGQTGVIAGSVIDAVTEQPVRRAIVTVTAQGTPRRWATVRTDSSGEFRVDKLPPGKYDLRAMKPNVGTAVYGASSTRELGELIVLADGEVHAGVKLRFLHSATISGKVYEPDGDPAQNATVTLLHPTRNQGERALQERGSIQTNDRGEYRFDNLAPGQYYLRAARPDSMRGPGRPEAVTAAPQYLGGSHEWKNSRALNIRGDENLAGLDFQLNSEPVTAITGRVFAPDSQPGVVTISLSPIRDDGLNSQMTTRARLPDLAFTFDRLLPGKYRIEATLPHEGKAWTATAPVDVPTGNGEITLTLAPALEIKGMLAVEGPDAPERSSLRVQLSQPGRIPQAAARVAADGAFTLSPVTPGEWGVDVLTVQRPAFLKSALLGSKDVRFERFMVNPGAQDTLRLTVSTKSGEVHGEVDSKQAAGILLAPVGKFHNLARFYYNAAADDTGKFEMKGIAPGKYKIFALEKLAAVNFADPDIEDKLDSLGQEIEVIEGATLEAHPKLIPEEQAREALP